MDKSGIDKKALGRARLEAKKLRIANIRRKVAVFSASLALAFSGLVVGINGVPLLLGGREEPNGTEVVQTEGVEQQIGATVTALASDLILGDDDDDDEDEGGGFFDSSTSASVQSSQS